MARIESARSGKELGQVLLDLNLVSAENITKAKAIVADVPYVDLNEVHVDPNILKNLTKELAQKYRAVPFALANGSLNIAMSDPNNIQVIDFIEKKSGLPITVYLATDEGIDKVIDQYQDMGSEVTEALQNVGTDMQNINIDETTAGRASDLVQDAPVTRAVNTILEYAAKANASDVHIEPKERVVKIRYRIDGVLHETMSLPIHIHAALVSRIKILSNLKIDEHRVPQDGRFGIKVENHDIDLRVSISPTVFGEKVVIRLLDKSGGLITLEDLGIRGRAYKLIEAGSRRPHGMLLSTGPTGSGKSTTLYALLNKMNSTEVNIVTLEDPVEYKIEGINQIQINQNVGLTFASGLRSILRQDPNVIMVGEIRDAETAELAVQSALTGHTVLSTLHTNNAAGVLPRLLDMDIEPFLIASTVNTVIGQRLVRKICSKCRESYTASPSLASAIKKAVGHLLPAKAGDTELGYENLPSSQDEKITLYKGKGCDACRNTGYHGRIGIFEVFPVTTEMERLLLSHSTSQDLQEAAVKEGMITLREDGFLKALEGITTIEEVVSKASEN